MASSGDSIMTDIISGAKGLESTPQRLREKLEFIIKLGEPEALCAVEDKFGHMIANLSGKMKSPRKRFRGT